MRFIANSIVLETSHQVILTIVHVAHLGIILGKTLGRSSCLLVAWTLSDYCKDWKKIKHMSRSSVLFTKINSMIDNVKTLIKNPY